MGLQMIKNKEIDLIESVSKVNYANGLSYFSTNGIRNHENEASISHFEMLIQAYLNLLSP
jgi:glycerol-3-phosphate O-acyltransferase